MTKLKIILVAMVIPIVVMLVFIFLRVNKDVQYRQKVGLAQQTRKVMDHLMFDLREAKEESLQDLPADGKWHDRIAFDHQTQGPLEYVLKEGHLARVNGNMVQSIADDIGSLRIRRQKQTPDILEVEVQAQKGVSLVSNIKIRLHH